MPVSNVRAVMRVSGAAAAAGPAPAPPPEPEDVLRPAPSVSKLCALAPVSTSNTRTQPEASPLTTWLNVLMNASPTMAAWCDRGP